ncbi:reactive intermediate/imine deaminase [Micromonospora globispora]|uniref:Reactive intermediate/imine deaminase n=1 Tax=Micromonospora globispora TaxID=1450148 RepID=A0A317K167_9ACTN|nr:RidA family protein [Micromonospora globispora]PWU44883.1 reactive intermediate/imine deaminase [Micromonospora globispora]RQW88161.1 reactive intermediate/imine deaminase [Micromonospora globispora]
MSHQSLVADSLPPPGGAYSHVTAMDGLVFTAGFGPHDPETGRIPDGIEAQTEATLANVARALGAVGLDLSHVLKVTVHLADLHRNFSAFNETYARILPQPYPVRTTVGSQLLGILVEIDVVAGTPRP